MSLGRGAARRRRAGPCACNAQPALHMPTRTRTQETRAQSAPSNPTSAVLCCCCAVLLQVLRAFPEALACDVQARLAANVKELGKTWRLTGGALTKALIRQPQVWTREAPGGVVECVCVGGGGVHPRPCSREKAVCSTTFGALPQRSNVLCCQRGLRALLLSVCCGWPSMRAWAERAGSAVAGLRLAPGRSRALPAAPLAPWCPPWPSPFPPLSHPPCGHAYVRARVRAQVLGYTVDCISDHGGCIGECNRCGAGAVCGRAGALGARWHVGRGMRTASCTCQRRGGGRCKRGCRARLDAWPRMHGRAPPARAPRAGHALLGRGLGTPRRRQRSSTHAPRAVPGFCSPGPCWYRCWARF
jgi:hypothetical protein